MRHRSSADIRQMEYSEGAGVGFLRAVLLFGSASVSLGLVLIPFLMQQPDRERLRPSFIRAGDHGVTGSVKPDDTLRLPFHSSPPQR